MTDRQPTYPGRVLITPENGEAYYATLERADEPTEAGTALNKANLLQDSTCALLDIPDSSVPNDAFVKLALGIGKYGYVVHVQYPDGSPAEGYTLTGLNAPDGTPAVTDANGDAVGVSTEQSVTIGVDSPYIDIQDVSGQTVESTGVLTEYTVTLAYNNNIQVNSSQQIQFSPSVVTFDLCAIGAGGGGAYNGSSRALSGGGGSGYITSVLGISAENNNIINIQIGSGGAAGSSTGSGSGGNGGTTSATSQQGVQLISAPGGNGGTGGADGTGGTGGGDGRNGFAENSITSAQRPAANGKPYTAYAFNDPSAGAIQIGGGGGSLYSTRDNTASTRASGANTGADGAGVWYPGSYPILSAPATTAGIGGGGGGGIGPDFNANPSDGGRGQMRIRCHYVAA